MHHEDESYSEELRKDSPIIGKIQEFATPLRLEILRALYDNGRQSQGELALCLGLKPTALANRLLKFDGFTPKLLEKAYEGKYCYYTLSDWGQRFMAWNSEAGSARVREDSALLGRQDEILLASAKASVAELKRCFGDEWGKVFDNVLVRYTQGSRFAPDSSARKLAGQFLKSFELLMMHQNERLYVEALAVLEDGTLRNRMTDFIDKVFLPFSHVLEKMQKKDNLFSVGAVLEFVFTGEGQDIAAHSQALGWNSGDLQELQETALRVKECLSGYVQEEIYDYFTILLPEQEAWAWIVSRWI